MRKNSAAGLYPMPNLRRLESGPYAGKLDMESAECFPAQSAYEVDVPWPRIDAWIAAASEMGNPVELCPDFQRGRVWTRAQKQAFIEFQMMGGHSGRAIYWNCPSYSHSASGGALQLVDGLQRITAVQEFLAGKVKPFGYPLKEWCGSALIHDLRFRFYVNELKTRAEVLRWYLLINAGGTPHSPKEIARVKAFLEAEEAGSGDSA